MNFKERGLTVGDVLLFLIIILISYFAFKSTSDNDKKSLNFNNQTIALETFRNS